MTSVWPTSDTFDDGTPAANLRGYYGVLFDDGTLYQRGRLVSGYGGVAGGVQDPSLVETDEGKPMGLARREELLEDVQVRGTFTKRLGPGGGTLPANAVNRHGVFCRLTAGTGPATAGTGNQKWSYLSEVTCYAFEVRRISGSSYRLVLSRWDLGTETVLAQSDLFTPAQAEWLTQHSLSLTATTVAGDVELVAAVAQVSAAATANKAGAAFGSGGAGVAQPYNPSTASSLPPGTVLGPVVNSPGVDERTEGLVAQSGAIRPIGPLAGGGGSLQTVLSATDTSGSKIAAAGRCGFVLDGEVATTAPQYVSTCDLFEVVDPETQVPVWRDEWDRAAASMAAPLADGLGTVGRDLTSDWSTDLGGVEAIFQMANGSDAVDQGGLIDLGSALDIPGTVLPNNDYLRLATPANAFAPPPDPDNLELTISLWIRPGSNRDGNQFYQATDAPTAPTEGFAFGWRDAGSGNAVLRAALFDASGVDAAYDSSAFAASTFVDQSYCYTMTWKARANAAGEGRLRVYRGRLGVATVLIDELVDETCRPAWLLGVAHSIGQRCDTGSGSASDLIGDFTVDRLVVFYDELSAVQVAALCSEVNAESSSADVDAVHALNFNDPNATGGNLVYTPHVPASATGTWVIDDGASEVTGLVSSLADSVKPVLHQRPVASVYDVARSVSLTLPEPISRAGLLLRASGFTDAGDGTSATGTAYRLLVGIGNPAPVYVERVLDGVATLIGEADATSLAAVVEDAAFTLVASVRRSDKTKTDTPAVLALTVGGTAVPLAAAGADPDVYATSAGELVDASSDRIASGGAVGFAVVTPAGTLVHVDAFAVAAVPGETAPEVGGPTLTLAAEDEGVSGDLATVFDTDWPVTVIPVDTLGRVRTEDARDAVYQTDLYERRRVLIRASSMRGSAANFEALLAFAEARGDHTPFAWTTISSVLPHEPSGIFRFARPTLNVQGASNGALACSVELIECVQSS